MLGRGIMFRNPEVFIALIALAVSIFALLSSFVSNKHETQAYINTVYERFSQMWFSMDGIFIDKPHMRQFFYKDYETNQYAELRPDDENYTLGICIAEMFCDVFQYCAPLEYHLTAEDRASYNAYKNMIMNAPIVRIANQKNGWFGDVQKDCKKR